MLRTLLIIIINLISFTLNHKGIDNIDIFIVLTEHTEECTADCVDEINVKVRFGLDNKRDISSFIRYIKTQSNRSNTDKGLTDIYFVIQTIYNRLEHKKCTWREYYNNKNLNHSRSIMLMRTGRLKTYFSMDRYSDRLLYIIAYMANIGMISDKYRLPKSILFFRSGKNFKDKSPHLKKNLYCVARHHFYTG